MDSNIASKGAYHTDYPSLEEGPSRSDRLVRGAASPLIRETSFIALCVLSLGFWGATLLAVASLALARLW